MTFPTTPPRPVAYGGCAEPYDAMLPPIEPIDTTAILIGEVRVLTIENESLRQRLCAAEAAVSRAEVVRHRGGW